MGWLAAVPGSWMREKERKRGSHSLVASPALQETEMSWSETLCAVTQHFLTKTRVGMVSQWAAQVLVFHLFQAELWLHMHDIAKSITDKYYEKREEGWWWSLRFYEHVMLRCSVCWLKHFCKPGSEKWQNDIMSLCFVKSSFIWFIGRWNTNNVSIDGRSRFCYPVVMNYKQRGKKY